MAADLHIHVYRDITEDDLRAFFGSTLSSKYFNPFGQRPWAQQSKVFEKISDTPNVWIGEVSWLKAALMDDAESFVPNPVGTIHELVGEDLPTLNPDLRDKIVAALQMENSTSYSIAKPDAVEQFLNDHMGERLFTVSW